MPNSDDEIIESPTAWVAEHVERYVATNGEEGYSWQGVPTLLLTTRGRRSNKLRRTALIFGRDGEDYLLVASKGGAAAHPLWYENLVVDERVTVQVKDEEFAAIARTASAGERARLWQIMTAVWPAYDEYQARTEREIPVVIVQRTS